MRVGIIAPNYYPAETGNAVTVRRIEGQLRLLGCEVRVFPVGRLAGERLQAEVEEFAPQLLHAFHAYHGGRVAYALSKSLGIPYLITLTGTDIYQALCDQRGLEMHGALRRASRLVAFHACVKKRLGEHLPSLEERTVLIHQGVELPTEYAPPAGVAARDEFVFLLPAGLRPVKNVMFPLAPLAELHARYPQVRLELAGPVLEPAYAAEVMETLEQYPFARYLGVVAHDAMGDLYRRVDVVLNTSVTEGGMANTILEALAYAKPVLVSDIEGNRSIIKDGVTGLVYHSAADFCSKAEHLVTDAHLRDRLGKNGRCLVRDSCCPEKEAGAYLALYRDILATA
ncbi:GPMC system family 4 glycosyltransferase [Geomonas paludis]|uniref:GPMC system family 4 glycosyltransferase n=1 Tax=Geomonas paludis TaxID=2740185 RepID=A0A6V8MRR9_9BACT|nr:GPMC system family 4 glycosyltransferase [Geomonas paludis]UPU35730.1 GPMC system family 4 glycosyltransferase [Geomonas paludis]GFO62691.1 glycosyl transferase [Geomonas paludis]